MILLKELKLNNFLSHESTTLDFGETEKLLLGGRSGSGKSSITEAVLWGLFGKGRTDNRSLVRRGARSATVSLKLVDGSKETLVTRSVSSTGKNTLIITQNTGSKGQFLPIERVGIKDCQDWIEDRFLKASYELFTNSVAYPQENENSFVKANVSKRKDLLLEIVHAGNFDQLYEKARIALASNELDNAVAISKMSGLDETIKSGKIVADKYDSHKKTHDEASTQIDLLSVSEKNLEKQMNDITQVSKQISDKKRMKEMVLSSIHNIDFQLSSDKRIVEEHNRIDITAARKNIEDVKKLSTEAESIERSLKDDALAQLKINAHLSNKPSVFDYTKDIENLNKRLIPLIKDMGKCPAGDACPFVVPIKGQVEFLTQQIEEKAAKSVAEQIALEEWQKEYVKLVPPTDSTTQYNRLSKIREEIKVLSESQKVVIEYESFEKTSSEILIREMKLNEEKKVHDGEILSIDKEIKDLEQALAVFDSNKINSDLATIRTSIKQLQDMKNEALAGMLMANEAAKAIEQATTVLTELKIGILKAGEDKESLELLKEALSPRGIKAVVIDYLVPQLEERINAVLAQMSDFRIRLDTQKATVDEEGVKEGLFITVLNDRKEELPFASYSGGEKVKITIAISEALASLMNQIGFRIMDENIVSLDRESTEGFVVVLTKLQEKFSQLLVISHLQEVKDIFEKQVTIIKTNGISKIL